jgi:hypothetical protein
MIRRILQALVVVLAPAIAQAETFKTVAFPGGPGEAVDFAVPGGNIGCIYIPAGGTKVYQPREGGPELSCDRIAPKYVHVELGTSGKATQIVNPGEQGCCNEANTLGHGQRWSGGPFTCGSAKSGLTCKRHDRHGFSISRQAIKLY